MFSGVSSIRRPSPTAAKAGITTAATEMSQATRMSLAPTARLLPLSLPHRSRRHYTSRSIATTTTCLVQPHFLQHQQTHEHPQHHGEQGWQGRVAAAALAGVVLVSSEALAPSQLLPQAHAFGTPIELSEVQYEVTPCPTGTFLPDRLAGRGNFTCLACTAQANNAGKDAEAANVFGFVSDAENNSALAVNPDGDTRTVIASIDKPVPHGKSEVGFVLVASQSSIDKPPLKFKGFKATSSPKNVEEHFAAWDPCELDPFAEECLDF